MKTLSYARKRRSVILDNAYFVFCGEGGYAHIDGTFATQKPDFLTR